MPLGVSMALQSTEPKTILNNRGDNASLSNPVPYWDRVAKFISV
jgi:hypothetical protein